MTETAVNIVRRVGFADFTEIEIFDESGGAHLQVVGWSRDQAHRSKFFIVVS